MSDIKRIVIKGIEKFPGSLTFKTKSDEKCNIKSRIITKSNVSQDYDNNQFPIVRFPIDYTVPNHLVSEFEQLFASEDRKFSLRPNEKLGGRSKDYLTWLLFIHWRDPKHL